MKRRLPPLNPLQAFEAAARHMNITRAADELGVTQSAVSRQVRFLEERLGVRLFVRSRRGIVLTGEGEDLFGSARAALDMIEEATARITRHARPVLRVRAYIAFAMRWLIPRLPAFTEMHPDCEVRLTTSMQPVNFDRDDVDLAMFGELHGIVPVVDQHLPEPERIPDEVGGDILGDVEDQLESFGVRLRGNQGGHIVEHLLEREVRGLHGQLARLDLGEVEDVIDDAEEVAPGILNGPDALALARSEVGL